MTLFANPIHMSRTIVTRRETINLERIILDDKFQLTITIRDKIGGLKTFHRTKFHKLGQRWDQFMGILINEYGRIMYRFLTETCIKMSVAHSQIEKLPLFVRFHSKNMYVDEFLDDGYQTIFDRHSELWITCDNDMSVMIAIVHILSYKLGQFYLEDYSGEFTQFNRLKEHAEDTKMEDKVKLQCYKVAYIKIKMFYLKEFGEVIGECLSQIIVPIRAIILDYVTG